MAHRPSDSRAEAAYFEDYNEESETAVPETRKTANITAKRSKPDVSKVPPPRDEISDSGHSSQTLATLGSTNSSLASKSASDTIKAESHAVLDKAGPPKIERNPQRKPRSTENAQSRRATSRNRKDENARREECNCNQCIAKAGRATPQHSSKPAGKARASGPEASQSRRRAPMPIPQNAPSRPRASTSHSYHRDRPLSFHAGAAPEPLYSQPIESRPTMRYVPIASIMTPSYSPHVNSYFPPAQSIHQPQAPLQTQQFYSPPPSPFEPQARPRPRQWTSDYPRPPRPQSMIYATSPIIEYITEPVYAPILAPAPTPSRQSSRREHLQDFAEQRFTRDEDCYNMPPPAPPPPSRSKTRSEQDRRPVMWHAMTADVPPYTHRRAGRDESTTGHVGHEGPIKQSYRAPESAPRPRRNTSDETIPRPRAVERRMTHGQSDGAKHRRRASIYGHESSNKLADESEAVEAVEAYQASKGNRRASSYGPIPPPALMRKKTHTSSKSSETSSRKSGKSGKSGKSRTSRTSKTSRDGSDLKSRRPSEDDYFSMRVDASRGVNVDLMGGMDGRRITLRQNKDEREMEFSIGSQQGKTATGAGREIPEKSRRSYSYRDGHSEIEVDRAVATSQARKKIMEKEEGDETEPKIVRERVTTTTRTRSLRDSSRVRGD